MNSGLVTVLALLAAAATMFALNRPRADVVGFLLLVAMPLTGVIEVRDALAGFSDSNVILIAFLFVIGAGLVRTGVAGRLAELLVRHAGSSETRLLVLLMLLVATAGSVMSSTAIVAIFIPVVLRICRSSRIPPASLMMPLSMAALVSGMMTLVGTSPNLIINGELVRRGLDGFGFFSITPFGVPILALAVLYMLFARRWLVRDGDTGSAKSLPSLAAWAEEFSLASREFRGRVLPGSILAERAISALDRGELPGVQLIAIERHARLGSELIEPRPDTRLVAGDVLYLDVANPGVDVTAQASRLGLELLPLDGPWFSDLAQEVGMAELLVAPGSELVGLTPAAAGFRDRFGLAVIGIKHGRAPAPGSVLLEPMRAGDTLLVVGPWRAIRRLTVPGGDLVVLSLPAEFSDAAPAARRAPYALAATALMVVLMVTGVVSNVQAAMLACVVMGMTGCLGMDDAYDAIQWRSLMVIVGILPFSIALESTGGVDLAADAIHALVGDAGPRPTLAALFAVTAGLGLFISNTATAIIMAPIAITLAEQLGVSPLPFAMTAALASSTAFVTPVASPVNMLVVGPGNYRFVDFLRIGGPFAVVTLVVVVLMVPWLMPF